MVSIERIQSTGVIASNGIFGLESLYRAKGLFAFTKESIGSVWRARFE